MIGGIDDLVEVVQNRVAARWTKKRIKWTVSNWTQFVESGRPGENFAQLRKNAGTPTSYTARFQSGKQVTAPNPGIAVLACALSDAGEDISDILRYCMESGSRRRTYRLSAAERKEIVERGRAGETPSQIAKAYPAVTRQAISILLCRNEIRQHKKSERPKRKPQTPQRTFQSKRRAI